MPSSNNSIYLFYMFEGGGGELAPTLGWSDFHFLFFYLHIAGDLLYFNEFNSN